MASRIHSSADQAPARVLLTHLLAEADIPMGELPALYPSAENVMRASLHFKFQVVIASNTSSRTFIVSSNFVQYPLDTMSLQAVCLKRLHPLLRLADVVEAANTTFATIACSVLQFTMGQGKHSSRGYSVLRKAINSYLHNHGFTILEPNPGVLAVLLGGPKYADDIRASFALATRHREYLRQDAPQPNQAAAQSFKLAMWGLARSLKDYAAAEEDLAKYHLTASRGYADAAKQKRQQADYLARQRGEFAWSPLSCE